MAGKKEAAMKAMGEEAKERKGKPMPHHVHKMTIERGSNGGHVVHHEERGGHGESRHTGPHVMSNNDELHDHIDQTMGDQPAAGEGMSPSAAAAPAPGADPAGDPAAEAAQGM